MIVVNSFPGDMMETQQQYQIHGQTNVQGRSIMNSSINNSMNRPMYNKPMGYVMNPNNMNTYMNPQQRNYMSQQGMQGKDASCNFRISTSHYKFIFNFLYVCVNVL